MKADLTVVTTCKGRLHHLQRTLPDMLASGAERVVVVDYNCPQGTAQWVRANHPAAEVVHETQASDFSHARARNLGLEAVQTKWVAWVDADVSLRDGWRHWWQTEQAHHQTYFVAKRNAPGWDRGTYGTCVVPTSIAREVSGYDEVLKGWGGEDDDLFHRLEQVGCRPASFPAHLVSAIEHGDQERTCYTLVHNKMHSFVISRYYRSAKYQAMAFFRIRGELPLTMRQQIDQQIRRAFEPFLAGRSAEPPIVELTLENLEGLTDRWKLSKQCRIRLSVATA